MQSFLVFLCVALIASSLFSSTTVAEARSSSSSKGKSGAKRWVVSADVAKRAAGQHAPNGHRLAGSGKGGLKINCANADFGTIEDALDVASDGDQIFVCPGTYGTAAQPIAWIVDKQVLLSGYRRTAKDQLPRLFGSFRVDANDVTIQFFEMDYPLPPASLSVLVEARSVDGLVVRRNHLHGPAIGVSLEGASNSWIHENKFNATNRGVQLVEVSGRIVTGNTISDNLFIHSYNPASINLDQNSAIFVNVQRLGVILDNVIENNHFHYFAVAVNLRTTGTGGAPPVFGNLVDDGRLGLFQIRNNSIVGPMFGVWLRQGNRGHRIEENHFSRHLQVGVLIEANNADVRSISAIMIRQNNFTEPEVDARDLLVLGTATVKPVSIYAEQNHGTEFCILPVVNNVFERLNDWEENCVF